MDHSSKELSLENRSVKNKRKNSTNFNSPRYVKRTALLNEPEKDQGSTSVPIYSRLQSNKNIDIYETRTELDAVPTFGGDQDEPMNGIRPRDGSTEDKRQLSQSDDENENPFVAARDSHNHYPT